MINHCDIFHEIIEMFETIERGSLNTSTYRLYFKNDVGPVSPFHDIPLYVDAEECVFNMIVEIPRWTNDKMEISLNEPLNPIKQDELEGELRNLPNCFPYHGIPWNYGALPQTLEDPTFYDELTNLKGDGDPVDTIEIGQGVSSCGEVLQVKVLGALGLIDRNKMDWKLISLSTKDEYSGIVNNLSDIDYHFPGMLKCIKEWFDIYKIVAGKPENKFCFNGDIQGPEVAHKVIKSAHKHWRKIINANSTLGITTVNLTHVESPNNVSVLDAEAIVNASAEFKSPHSRDPVVDMWHFIHQK